MIEFDLINYLKADSTLDSLLGSSSSNSKITPATPRLEPTAPYVTYLWGVGDQTDEHLDEDRIQLNVISDNMEEAKNIRNRIKVLLDKLDSIQETTFNTSSSDYCIYYCRFDGGFALFDEDRQNHQLTMFYIVKYSRKTKER